jgi:endonuclease III
MVLYENVAYLVDDAHRDRAFENLRRTIGTRPADILTASPDQLETVSKLAGSNKRGQVAKMVRAAEIAEREFNGDVAAILRRPAARARAALKKFPGIGDPGAEKILLFNRAAAILALESNGLRVLTRIGFAREQPNYAATYRAVQRAVEPDIPNNHDWLIRAYQVLRKHGQTICRRRAPLCGQCVVQPFCSYGRPDGDKRNP